MERITGDRYSSDRDITEIAKLVRADIKAAVAARELPAPSKRPSVRVSRYAGGQSLDIEFLPIMEMSPNRREEVVVKLRAITDRYNFNYSDSMCDYFNVNFYCHVRVGPGFKLADVEQL